MMRLCFVRSHSYHKRTYYVIDVGFVKTESCRFRKFFGIELVVFRTVEKEQSKGER